ncbi:MAG: 4Fe-4S binding protein [Ruminococcaceae bacterium]|nr:4Fe-4S binding protein [Oscillospiraceae bacterium]
MPKISKRRVVQVLSAMLYNMNLKGFAKGSIYTGKLKSLCVPGLNCYSCPGAISSCPLGSFQSALSDIKYKFPLYVLGLLALFGVVFARAICSFLCPFGLIQELLYKIPAPKIKKNRITRRLSAFKYVVLFVLVLIVPILTAVRVGMPLPSFCKYICPVGILEGALPLLSVNTAIRELLGTLFWFKLSLLIFTLVFSVFIYRPFCRFICPLGAVYSFFNRISITGIKVDKDKCAGCNACVKNCKMDVAKINDRECIRCGECVAECKFNAIYFTPERKVLIYDKKKK